MHGMENFPIEELEFGVRSYNCLKRVGIETIGDLAVEVGERAHGACRTRSASWMRRFAGPRRARPHAQGRGFSF